ncbi:hypothetical protein CPC08DRAFT_347855 [Agrocybe pediades]|nr:hypothetical protein CPC08DRAFT_347855 [Agrocybe pediades]
MSAAEYSITQITSDIWGCMMALPVEQRRDLMAILKWNTDVSEGILHAWEHVDSPWTKQSIMDEYLVFLNDLTLAIQQVPIVLADIADCNIKLDALQARISPLSPTSAIRSRTQDDTERSRGLSMFHDVQQIAIFGGNFTVASPRAVEGEDVTSLNEEPMPLRTRPDRTEESSSNVPENVARFSVAWIVNFLKKFFRRE